MPYNFQHPVKWYMEIILVRHGETDHNKNKAFHGWIDSELNTKGILQAEKVSRQLAGEKIDAIYSSPLKRAAATADIIAGKFKVQNVNLVQGLKEINFGLFEGLTYQEISENYSDEAKMWEKQNLEYHFPEGEGIQDFYGRIKKILISLSKNDYKRIALITHEGCIRCILSHVTSASMNGFWKYSVRIGSISRVVIDKDFSYIMSLNENYKQIDFLL